MLGIVIVGTVCAVVSGLLVYLLMKGRSASLSATIKAKEEQFDAFKADAAADLGRQADQYKEQIEDLNLKLLDCTSKLNSERARAEDLGKAVAKAEEAVAAREKAMEEARANFDDLRAKSEAQFRDLAQKIFEERSEKMKKEGAENIQAIIKPLANDIREFGKRIEESNKSVDNRGIELGERIRQLVEQTHVISSQANNLAEAVRGSAKVSGDWGEIELKRVLELSGMQPTIDYTFQDTFSDEPGGRKTKRTDFIIRMTGGRKLIIDSKNTVASLLELYESDDPAHRDAICDRIVDSVKKHIDELASANYHEVVEKSFPQVLMFIPIDEVYLMAMKAMVNVSGQKELLREYAYRRNVILVNSANVVLVAKIVEKMWEIDSSERNREEIVHAAEELLRRTNDFFRAFREIGSDIDKVRCKFDELSVVLSSEDGRRNGIPAAAAKLVKLGIKPKAGRSGKPYELEEPIKELCE